MKKVVLLVVVVAFAALCAGQVPNPPNWVSFERTSGTSGIIRWSTEPSEFVDYYYLSLMSDDYMYMPPEAPSWYVSSGYLPGYNFSLASIIEEPGVYRIDYPAPGKPDLDPAKNYIAYVASVEGNGWSFSGYSDSFHNPRPDDTLPVTLSSFTAQFTASSFVTLRWVSESESMLSGYRILRNTSANAADAVIITPALISPTNTSLQQIYKYEDHEVEADNTYYYWLESVEMNNQSTLHGPVNVVVTSEPVPEFPVISGMGSVYPNPFRSGLASVDVTVKAGDTAMVSVYNTLGQVVRTFTLNPGTHKVEWDGRDARGTLCSSGVYFYKLSSQSVNQTRKMVIIK
ncbi:MAG TPA: T9SS type A sorting domain-containing protein [Candidatus Cloacimonadota bacterium]|nr:T9SS type A sorting domain-containing protein [Candidatus Cloacimonadota bacterium]